jgi:hypothetical protein
MALSRRTLAPGAHRAVLRQGRGVGDDDSTMIEKVEAVYSFMVSDRSPLVVLNISSTYGTTRLSKGFSIAKCSQH